MNIVRNRTRKHGLLAAVVLLVSIFGATAAVQAHGGHTHNPAFVDEGQVVNRTMFVAGRDLTMAGEVEGDYICAGQNVTISGRVQGDVLCASQNIRITGTVDGDIRIAAQTVSLGGAAAGSASIAAQSVQLDRSSKFERDVSITATDVRLDGRVGRDLQLATEQVIINGLVGRNVTARTQAISLASDANIRGAIEYTSPQELQRQANAQVAGQIKRDNQPGAGADSSPGAAMLAAIWATAMVSLLVTSLILVLIAPKAFKNTVRVVKQRPLHVVLLGIAVSILPPIVAVLLMSTIVGIPLGVLILLGWLLLLFLSGPVSAYLVGSLLLRNGQPWLVMLAGGALLVLLYSVPLLNVFVASSVVWVGSGVIVAGLLRQRSTLKPPKSKDLNGKEGEI